VESSTLDTIRAAEEAVRRLVEVCQKPGRLYARNPRAVAQVGRTAKWLLHALAALHRAIDPRGPRACGKAS
jgi:hypothetical protein